MIEQIRIISEHFEPSENLKEYVIAHISKLDKYLTRRARRTVRAEVVLREEKARSTADDTVEVILHVPDDTLKAHASAETMDKAVDLVEHKLRQQIETYRTEHRPTFYRHMMRRFRGKIA